MDVIIVCHTEFGFVSNEDLVFEKKSILGVEDGVLNLVKLADKYGAKISFAVCPEIVEYFPKNINHEIGLHVHPGWQELTFKNFKFFVGDRYLRENCSQSVSSTFLKDFPYEEQLDMISKGSKLLKSELNVDPKFFVAGRWSLNDSTIKAIIRNGFTHDCSASSYLQTNYPDWSKIPRICMPYHPDEDDYQKKGKLPITIVPVSQYFPRGNVNPEVAGRVGLSWLKACFLEYYRQGLPLFHICLHSPSMTDSNFILAMESLISFISKHKNINFKFVTEIKEYPEIKTKTDIIPYIFSINKNILKTLLVSKILKADNGYVGNS